MVKPINSSRPWPEMDSTRSSAKNPSMQARPLIFSAQVTNPNLASGTLGVRAGVDTPGGGLNAALTVTARRDCAGRAMVRVLGRLVLQAIPVARRELLHREAMMDG